VNSAPKPDPKNLSSSALDNIKTLGLGLIVVAVIFVIVILLQIWGSVFAEDLFIRLLITIGVVGAYGIYVAMVWDDIERSKYRNMLLLMAGVGGIVVVLVLLQTWFESFTWEFFGKSLLTLFIISGLVSFIMVVREDMLEGKRLKDEDYID
jgi:MFS family permease